MTTEEETSGVTTRTSKKIVAEFVLVGHYRHGASQELPYVTLCEDKDEAIARASRVLLATESLTYVEIFSRQTEMVVTDTFVQKIDKKPVNHDCWMCKKPGATIRTEPQAPDNEEWWFHTDCYWKLQNVLC